MGSTMKQRSNTLARSSLASSSSQSPSPTSSPSSSSSSSSHCIPKHDVKTPTFDKLSPSPTVKRKRVHHWRVVLRTFVGVLVVVLAWFVRTSLFWNWNRPSTSRKRFRPNPSTVLWVNHTHAQRLGAQADVDVDVPHPKRTVECSLESLKRQKQLTDEAFYNRGRADVFETDDCVAQHPWQLRAASSTCNLLHEVDLLSTDGDGDTDEGMRVEYLASGYWRDVWKVSSNLVYHPREEPTVVAVVLKTLGYRHAFDPRNYDRHRRETLAMERLTQSPHVIDVYGHCGNSQLSEYAVQGDLDGILWPPSLRKTRLTDVQKLLTALQIAIALADVHTVDHPTRASMAHTDVTPGQFLLLDDGVFKIGDFNRVRFLRWNDRLGQPCGYRVSQNPGKFRSPEEYRHAVQSEAVDVYSMGNLYYSLLTERWPYEDVTGKDARKDVIAGGRPRIPVPNNATSDPVVVAALETAIRMCWIQDPEQRSSAVEVERFLTGVVEGLPP